MAILNVNYMSRALMRTVDVKVILPVDKMDFKKNYEDRNHFKTLYLLHGIFGDCNDWINFTRISIWAMERNLAVVMPSGENHFYTDTEAPGMQFGTFVGKELVEMTRKMFPLSSKREDTFIGGLSMGGFGALQAGIRYCDTFGYITAFSSAMVSSHIGMVEYGAEDILSNREFFERCFGDLSKLKTEKEPIQELAEKQLAAGKELPKIYMACGEQDFLLEANNRFVDFLRGHGVDVTYHTSPGDHNWAFWDTYMEKALLWLPLGEATQSVSSGNVKEKER